MKPEHIINDADGKPYAKVTAPGRIGDQGQRYMVQIKGWISEDDKWHNAAYGNEREGIIRLANGFLNCPGCYAVRVLDREYTMCGMPEALLTIYEFKLRGV